MRREAALGGSQARSGERQSAGSLRAIDARLKLIAAVGFIVAVIATPFGQWRAFGLEGMLLSFVIGLSGIPPLELARKWLGFFVLVGFLAVTIAPGHPAREQHGIATVVATVLVKNGLAILTVLVLSGVTEFDAILTGLRRLGMPRLLVSTMLLMDRYRHVLLEELSRMVTARRSRSFRRGQTLPWTILGGLIALLFLRTFERAERVHGSMVSRGWDGTIRTLDDEDR
jgi:cobalt/nickel transport system permease protein